MMVKPHLNNKRVKDQTNLAKEKHSYNRKYEPEKVACIYIFLRVKHVRLRVLYCIYPKALQ